MTANARNLSASSHNRLLRLGRAVFLVYAVLLLALFLLSLPGYWRNVSAGTVPNVSFDAAWPAGNGYFTARAAAAGLSLERFMLANTLASLLVITIHTAVAGLIFWRLPGSGFGLLSAFVIFLTGTGAVEDVPQVAGLTQGIGPWLYLFFNLGALVWPIFPIWLYLFPNGRAVPRLTRWPIGILMGAFLVLMIIAIVTTAGLMPPALWQAIEAFNERFPLYILLVLPGVLLALGSQVYRYLRVSSPTERQQTKWFVFGLALFAVSFFTSYVPILARVEAISGSLALMIIPLTIGIALLRYRLWDVDVVIRRTAGYAILTALLLLVYFGSVIVLQRLFTGLTGQESTLATILSTLLIAALFLPLRRRVQALIDRRFYRRKYDAAKVLESFAATARDETDLDRLTAELVRVIQETMQPEHASVWLRENGAEKKPQISQR